MKPAGFFCTLFNSSSGHPFFKAINLSWGIFGASISVETTCRWAVPRYLKLNFYYGQRIEYQLLETTCVHGGVSRTGFGVRWLLECLWFPHHLTNYLGPQPNWSLEKNYKKLFNIKHAFVMADVIFRVGTALYGATPKFGFGILCLWMLIDIFVSEFVKSWCVV